MKKITNIIIENYDISPFLIKKIYEHLHNEIVEIYKKHEKIQRKKDIDVDSGWEEETCGYIYGENDNGMRKYCNVHKYTHYQIEDDEISHTFKEKDAQDVTYYINLTKFKIFEKERINNILKELCHLINNYIAKRYELTFVTLNTTNDLKKINERMMKNKFNIFKSKKILVSGTKKKIKIYEKKCSPSIRRCYT